MKILVTGGAGYIGSVVVEQLVAAGHEPIVVDNLEEGHRAAVPADVQFIEASVADRPAIRSVLESNQIDAVCHLAALSIVPQSMVDPGPTLSTNVHGGLSLLQAMVDVGTERIVFSSTAAVYGEPTVVPIVEDADRVPVNPYGESKLMMERFLYWFNQAHGMKSISLRYFNAAGATELHGEDHHPETHLIPNILHAASGAAGPVNINGFDFPTRDGTAERDYVHVVDIADAHVRALDRIDEKACAVYNLGAGRGATVQEMLNAAEKVVGKTIPSTPAGRRAGDPAILLASNAKAREELGWEPRNSNIEQVLSSAWAWRQAHPDGYAD